MQKNRISSRSVKNATALFAGISLIYSCSPSQQPLSSSMDNNIFANTTEPLGGQKAAAVISSSKDPAFFRKELISENITLTRSFSVQTAGAQNLTKKLTLDVSQNDAKRVWILNLKRHKSHNLSDLKVKVNGDIIFSSQQFPQDFSEISLHLKDLKVNENQLEVLSENPQASDIQVSVVGFVRSEDIPHSVHSRVPDDAAYRHLKKVPGRIGIKFREGMKVRLPVSQNGESIQDENGISLILQPHLVG